MRRPSGGIRRTLEAGGLSTTGIDALGVVELPSTYAGRAVTYFRVFDPQRAANRGVDVFTAYTFEDLNAHLDLVLWAGFIEPDGKVVLFSRPGTEAAARPPERPAAPNSPTSGQTPLAAAGEGVASDASAVRR
jgi:hypothetical protein